MGRAVVFGGYGTFGGHVAQELADQGIGVTVAGRDRARAEAFARTLGTGHRGLAADVTCPTSCRQILHGQNVAVNCAGPFAPFADTLLQACLDTGCHYADIADDRGYTRLLRGKGDAFRQKKLAAVHGCSSLPAISGVLALTALAGAEDVPAQGQAGLFRGKDNSEGPACNDVLVRGVGTPKPA